jgi:hypothetical protein
MVDADGIYAAVLLDFLLLALALVLAWLGYVMVRLWREARRHVLGQYQQRQRQRQRRQAHGSPAAASTEQQPKETQSVRRHRNHQCH